MLNKSYSALKNTIFGESFHNSVQTEPHTPRRVELEALKKAENGLQRGISLRDIPLEPEEREVIMNYQFMTN